MRPIEYAIRLLAKTDDPDVRKKREKIALILIEAAASDEVYEDAFDIVSGDLPELAIKSDSAPIVTALIKSGTGLDPSSVLRGGPLLLYAIEEGYEEFRHCAGGHGRAHGL